MQQSDSFQNPPEKGHVMIFILAMGMLGLLVGSAMTLVLDLQDPRFHAQAPMAIAVLISAAVCLGILEAAPYLPAFHLRKLWAIRNHAKVA